MIRNILNVNMSIFNKKPKMAENTNVSKHLEERAKKLKEIQAGNTLSTEVFNTAMDKEKEVILTNYLDIYDKALAKAKSLEDEKSKLSTGKKSFKKNEKGEFIEETTFDEQAMLQLKKNISKLESLYTAIDKAMVVGGTDNWKNLSKNLK